MLSALGESGERRADRGFDGEVGEKGGEVDPNEPSASAVVGEQVENDGSAGETGLEGSEPSCDSPGRPAVSRTTTRRSSTTTVSHEVIPRDLWLR